jgi:hypothetical protein
MRPFFCPRCHREVDIPPMVKQGRVKIGGKLELGCDKCGKGKIVLTAEDVA